MGGTTLIISGGILQIVGFALIAGDLYLIQRDEFGTPAIIGRFRRLFTGPQAIVLNLSDTIVVADAALTARGKIRKGPGESLVSRVEALEVNFGHLDSEVEQVYKVIKDEVGKAHDDLNFSSSLPPAVFGTAGPHPGSRAASVSQPLPQPGPCARITNSGVYAGSGMKSRTKGVRSIASAFTRLPLSAKQKSPSKSDQSSSRAS